MSPFAETFRNWKDFPNGLSVLIVDGDENFLHRTTAQLESYSFIVTSFLNQDEACAALANPSQIFHVALVEATTNTGTVDGYRILKFAKDIPIIMMSAMENMPMMVKSISLGAVEFLLKPLSQDKLKNIWQHVVRKALDSRDTLLPGFLEAGNRSVEWHQQTSEVSREKVSGKTASLCTEVPSAQCFILSVPNEKFAAPSTPQLDHRRMALTEAVLDESSLDSVQASIRKETHEEIDVGEKSLISEKLLEVKVESNDILTTGPELVAVKQEEDTDYDLFDHGKQEKEDINKQLLCCIGSPSSSVYRSSESELSQDSKSNATESKAHNISQQLAMAKPCKGDHTTVPKELDSPLSSQHNAQRNRGNTSLQTEDLEEKGGHMNAESPVSPQYSEQDESEKTVRDDCKRKTDSSEQCSKEVKGSNGKKKTKVDWTADLHRRFVQAVEYLGVDQAIPSRILEVMNVDGLTRHNIASHLQKYRSHKKHLFTRELEANSWHHQNSLTTRAGQSGNSQQLASQQTNLCWVQPYPAIHPSFQTHPCVSYQLMYPPLHVWGHPAVELPAMPVSPHYNTKAWPMSDGSTWQHPVADSQIHTLTPQTPYFGQPVVFVPPVDNSTLGTWTSGKDNSKVVCSDVADGAAHNKLQDLHPPKELLHEVISEALSNPWTPLPLGLKPPSMESVMAELERQGVNTLSPCT